MIGVSVGPIRANGKVTGDYAVIVLVDEKVPVDELAQKDLIPPTLDGVPVKVYEADLLEAL